MSLEEMDTVALEAVRKEADINEASGKQDFGVSPSAMLHEDAAEGWWAKDDVSGEPLDPAMVRAARKEELAYFRSMGVYEKVPVARAIEETGRKPIAVRWIDINKGYRECPVYRSRLVANEFRKSAQQDPELFAATPPSECLKMCLSKLATKQMDYTVLYLDVSRALFLREGCEACLREIAGRRRGAWR